MTPRIKFISIASLIHCCVLRFAFTLWMLSAFGCSSMPTGDGNLFQPIPTELPADIKAWLTPAREEHQKVSKEEWPNEIKKKKKQKLHPPQQKFFTSKDLNRRTLLTAGVKNPIWMNEKLVFSISYFGINAGEFTLETRPLQVLNHRKVYHFYGQAVSASLFSLFYRIHDTLESFMDYEGLFSHQFHLTLDESKQKRDSLEIYDSIQSQTFYWNRLQHYKNGYKETKEFSPIQAFSQDSLSALYYLRTFDLPTGAVITFPVVSEGKTWDAECTVLKRENMRTPFGKVQTIVIHPDMKYQGLLKKSGDSFLWLTDDIRKIPVRLEAKVKVGTIIANLRTFEAGTSSSETPSNLISSPQSSPSSLSSENTFHVHSQ